MKQQIKSIPNPHKALEELKKAIKDGRDLIGKGEWKDFRAKAELIQQLIEYLHTTTEVLSKKDIDYDRKQTSRMLYILKNFIYPLIDHEFATHNMYDYPLAIGGDTQKRIELSSSWILLEYIMKMEKIYKKEELYKSSGIYDRFMLSPSTETDMPEELLPAE